MTLRHSYFLAIAVAVLCSSQTVSAQTNPEDSSSYKQQLIMEQQQELEQSEAPLSLNQAIALAPSSEIAAVIFQLINQQRFKQVELLLQQYQQRSDADPSLVAYAKAQLATQQGQFKDAAAQYQQLLEYLPNFTRGKLDYARLLFLDWNLAKSRQMFQAVLQEDLPGGVKTNIQPFIAAIDKRQGWQVGTSIGYFYNSNITQGSNAKECMAGIGIGPGGIPMHITRCFSYTQAQAAAGINYSLSANRFVPLHNHSGVEVNAMLFGNHYPNKTKHNYTNASVKLAYAYKSARNKLSIGPGFEFRWEGNRPVYRSPSINLEWRTVLVPRWESQLYASHQRWNYLPHLKSNNAKFTYLSTNQVISLNQQTALFFGGDFSRKRSVEFKPSSFKRYGFQVGIYRELVKGVTAQVSYQQRQRKYAGFVPVWRVKRLDKERQLSLNLSLPRWQYRGIQPSIFAEGYRVDSNNEKMFSYKGYKTGLRLHKSW